MNYFSHILISIILLCFLKAEERTLTAEQIEELERGGDLSEDNTSNQRKIPDLTKGETIPDGKYGPNIWTLGPTGIAGIMAGKFKGDQILVEAILAGSPAEGKIQKGDVILGMNGKKFEQGGHLGQLIGNAIIEAERKINKGEISFQIWRDKNYVKRYGKKNVTRVDIDDLFEKARDDNSLYEWKSETARERESKGFDEYPIDPSTFDISITIRTFPEYSDTAPYDCPKTDQILEDAWKVIEKRFVVDLKKRGSGKGGMLEAIALIASGKPKHRKIVYDWVRSKNARQWHPPATPAGTMFEPGYRGYKGYQSWHHGFTGLNCALYYDATKDDFVLPALRKFAIDTALGQSAGGSWGHTFAYPSFNGGEFHKMNPGYGALNAAGNRCFFLIALAKKLGIEHPEIDKAIERAHKFFGSYVDLGAIPYGDFTAAATDDSNGKNTGIAFAMKLLGDKYGAKYFAMMSSHCAFTRRGGHGADYHGNWSSWAATMCGPQVRIYNERNLRWRRTLCRMFDGSFVYHSPTGYQKALRDPTATEILHQAVPLKQTLITGKDPDEDLYPTEHELKQLLSSARAQFNDPWLMEIDGIPWRERSTEEVLDMVNIFKPKVRGLVANELAKRFKAGEKDIIPKVILMLGSNDARLRDGAIRTISACGSDVVLQNLSKLTPLISDPKDFVQITAVKEISKATYAEDVQLAMLKETVKDSKYVSPNSIRNDTQYALFGKNNLLSNAPFAAGFDEDLVQKALEELISLDPAYKHFTHSRLDVWDKDTIVKLAGPLTFAAEEEQIIDQMFANRSKPAQDLLDKFGYKESVLATAHRLRKKAAIPRQIRSQVDFKRNLIDPETVTNNPGEFIELIEEFGKVLIDDPLQKVELLEGDVKVKYNLDKFFKLVKKTNKTSKMPSIAVDVEKMFQEKLRLLNGTGEKIEFCRKILKDPQRKIYFRQMSAMNFLRETLGKDALPDLLPYLGHDYWRLRMHSQELAVSLIPEGGDSILIELFVTTENTKSAVGILEVLSTAKSQAGLELANNALDHKQSKVRQAAVKAVFSIGGSKYLRAVISHLGKAKTFDDVNGCEQAILSKRNDHSHVKNASRAIISMLSECRAFIRPSLFYILAQLGDEKSMAALKQIGQTEDIKIFNELVLALSYAPTRKADEILLDFASSSRAKARAVGAHSVRRMVIGPNGYGDISTKEALDFADTMLKLNLNRRLIQYIGNIHEARALKTLMYCLKKGVSEAAEGLISSAEGMKNLSDVDGKIAAKALQDVIEYIEITQLRGGVSGKDFREYPKWKLLQSRAGKALIKIYKPIDEPIEGFDPLDLGD